MRLHQFWLPVLLLTLVARAAEPELGLCECEAVLSDKAAGAHALFSASFVFSEHQRPFSALKAMERAIEAAPGVPGFHARYGQLLVQRKRLREAAAAYGRAAEMDPATKSFRAAQARAFGQCALHADSARCWEVLLESAEAANEIHDAAHKAAAAYGYLSKMAEVERVWRRALEKLTPCENQLLAWQAHVEPVFSGLTAAIVQQGEPARALQLSLEQFARHKDWMRRSFCAEQARQIAVDSDETQQAFLARVEPLWRELLQSATSDEDRFDAARELHDILLLQARAEDALKCMASFFSSADPSLAMRAAHCAEDALQQLGDRLRLQQHWQAFAERAREVEHRIGAIDKFVSAQGDPDLALKLTQQCAVDFPESLQAQEKLAAALLERQLEEAALAAHLALRKKVPPEARANLQQNILRLTLKLGQPQRAAELIRDEFQAASRDEVTSWLTSLAASDSKLATETALTLLKCASWPRAGATAWLQQQEHPEALNALFALSEDASQTAETRADALKWLQRNHPERSRRIAAAEKLARLPQSANWQRERALYEAAECLARAGAMREGLELVACALTLHRKDFNPAPETLQRFGHYLLWLDRSMLRDLRTLQDAEEQTLAFYQQHWTALRGRFDSLVGSLARLRSLQQDPKGAVSLIDTLCAIGEDSSLRLIAAGLPRREPEQVWLDYLKYIKARVSEQERYIADTPERQHWPALPDSLLKFVETHRKADEVCALLQQMMAQGSATQREACADLLLSFLQSQRDFRQMHAQLEKLLAQGLTPTLYKSQHEMLAVVLGRKQSTTLADVRRRETALRSINENRRRLQENPEDYEAALVVARELQALGRGEESQAQLETALQMAPGDPLLLERYGREMVRLKKYATAIKQFGRAAEVAGRREDFEEAIVAACESAGKFSEVIEHAVAALEQGRSFRSGSAILDLSRRSNQHKLLLQQVRQHVQKAAAPQRLSHEFLELALQAAWDADDAPLAAQLVELLWQRHWREESLYWPLRRLADAADAAQCPQQGLRLRQAALTIALRTNKNVDQEHLQRVAKSTLALLGPSQAAELLMAVLRWSSLHPTLQRRSLPWDKAGTIVSAPEFDIASALSSEKQHTRTAVRTIFELVAGAARHDDSRLRQALAQRWETLLKAEWQLFERNPHAYSGPLQDRDILRALELEPKLCATVARTIKDAHLNALRRLQILQSCRLGDAGLWELLADHGQLPALLECTSERVLKERDGEAARGLLDVLAAILTPREAQRLRQPPPARILDMMLALCEIPGCADWVRAGELALQEKDFPRALKFARRGYAAPHDLPSARQLLIRALLGNGHSAEAQGLIAQWLQTHFDADDWRTAGEWCLKTPPRLDPDCCRLAVTYLSKADEMERAQRMPPVGAERRSLGSQPEQSLVLALAGAGQFDEALQRLCTSDFLPDPAWLNQLIQAFSDCGKLKTLNDALAAQIQAAPQNSALRALCARVAEKAGDRQRAIALLQAAKALHPTPQIVAELVEVLRRAGAHRAALAECQAWATSLPQDSAPLRQMAAICAELKDREGQLRALTMRIEIAADDAQACREVALELLELKEHARAAALLQRAAELRPENAWRAIDYAEALCLAGEHSAAEQACRAALALKPDHLAGLLGVTLSAAQKLRAHSLLSEIYTALGKMDLAAIERQALPAAYQRPALKDSAALR